MNLQVWIFLRNPPLYPSIDGWLLYRSNPWIITFTSIFYKPPGKNPPLTKSSTPSSSTPIPTKRMLLASRRGWIVETSLMWRRQVGHPNLLMKRITQVCFSQKLSNLTSLKKRRSWLIPSFLSFLNHASKICLMILRLKALTNKQNFNQKYKNIFSAPFSCDFSHSHMFNFNEHNQCKSPKYKLNNWSNLHIIDWMHAGTVTCTYSLSN